MSIDLIKKILEEIGLEPIDSEFEDEQNEESCVKQPTPIYEKKTGNI